MKKCIWLLTVLIGGIPTLGAQDRAEVALSGTVLTMSSASNQGLTRTGSSSGGVLASFRFWLTPRHGVEFNYGHATDTQTITGSVLKTSLDTGIHEVSGSYIFRIQPDARLRPFFGAGAALLQFNPQNSFLPAESQNKPGIVYSAGLDVGLTQHLAMRLQFRGLVFAAPSFMSEIFRSNTMHHMSEPTFGFVYRF